ncbi:hypothetical protein N7492_002938 [Penicillium capsulatum]|uniref:Methyltransferase domain-containing protein n=1 Tax=Penicillium capsulatum TaxID=69766 RepID=A0A9W9IIG8_9EURO|nr:hypothetical protein N7492_002938 [Penicillium capsulatum]KAJ6122468.1 hypothetical protein N7512_004933 [Penicillium capsulatum]
MLGFLQKHIGKPRIYGFDHAVLNMQLPPTMWMNAGYWESTDDFPQACQALLDQVLAAGLLTDPSKSIRVLDAGCGCGDQSLYLASLKRNPTPVTEASGSEIDTSQSTNAAPRHRTAPVSSLPLIDTYIGITLEPSQVLLAKQRMQSIDHGSEKTSTATQPRVFCANAADPTSWSGDLQRSVTGLAATSQNPDTSTWLLALDAMYHFRPSRFPLLKLAHSTLHASFMAFDLILSDDVSWYQRLILRFVCWVSGSPYTNFISQAEYLRLLGTAGYDSSRVEIRDISRHVFTGLADFLGRRTEEGEPFGLKMTRYKVARVVFQWWATSGIVRGVVVVAKQ